MMRDYCEECKYVNKCEYAFSIRFCRDCKDYWDCDIRNVCCKAGHDIECDNGFEEENELDEEEVE